MTTLILHQHRRLRAFEWMQLVEPARESTKLLYLTRESAGEDSNKEQAVVLATQTLRTESCGSWAARVLRGYPPRSTTTLDRWA